MQKRVFQTFFRLCCILLALAFFVSCGSRNARLQQNTLASINIVDRNGFSETVSSKDRLKQYEQVDFLQTLPYQKVLRVYERDAKGDAPSYITSYYPNGQIKQYLEAVNGRASGTYREWHPNGKLKLEAFVIGGSADLDLGAEQSWLFDGKNRAWDETGALLAEISYSKGELQGVSTYYHKNGPVWKRIPYERNLMEGSAELFLDDGTLLQKIPYSKGIKHGQALRYWCEGVIASEENYENGLLMSATYSDKSGKLLNKIVQGTGYRLLFGKTGVVESHEYHKGVLQGQVRLFSEDGRLVRLYHVKNDLKHGEEIEFFPSAGGLERPKLSINWYEGNIQGLTKTWYDNGQPESQREMSHNSKNGLFTAWYREGSMMFMEEYDHDKLVKGVYYKKGERVPTSRVQNGKGMVTLFDAEGNLIRKVAYENGKPVG